MTGYELINRLVALDDTELELPVMLESIINSQEITSFITDEEGIWLS